MPETRKLAAILAADVVGYSKLAGADEGRTLARLRALRSDLFDPTIALHHGRVVKRTGDGVLIEFRSVVDAVRCAIEVQNGMAERNAGLPPERRIELRVGIHLGDVVEESDGDLMGMALTLLRDWRVSLTRALFAYPSKHIGRSSHGSILPSATWVQPNSRTLPNRYTSIRSRLASQRGQSPSNQSHESGGPSSRCLERASSR
jgi:hypothetical protein